MTLTESNIYVYVCMCHGTHLLKAAKRLEATLINKKIST